MPDPTSIESSQYEGAFGTSPLTDTTENGGIQITTPKPVNWQSILYGDLKTLMGQYARENNLPTWQFEGWLAGQWVFLSGWLQRWAVITPDQQQAAQVGSSFEGGATTGGEGTHPTAGEANTPLQEGGLGYMQGRVDPLAPGGLNALMQIAAQKLDQDLPGFATFVLGKIGGGPPASGGVGGARKPTPQELRAQFDVKQLTASAEQLGRSYLLEDIPNAKSIATAYIESVVKTGGEQAMDFTTFVVERLKNTSRWQLLYRNRPEGVDPLNYLAPYANAALEALGGNRGQGISQIVGEGAGLGASAAAFSARLGRTETVQNSSGFITGLEARMQGVSNILRG